jgi:hypothetical protein
MRKLARMLGERLEALAAHVQQLDAQIAVLRELTLRPPDWS